MGLISNRRRARDGTTSVETQEVPPTAPSVESIVNTPSADIQSTYPMLVSFSVASETGKIVRELRGEKMDKMTLSELVGYMTNKNGAGSDPELRVIGAYNRLKKENANEQYQVRVGNKWYSERDAENKKLLNVIKEANITLRDYPQVDGTMKKGYPLDIVFNYNSGGGIYSLV